MKLALSLLAILAGAEAQMYKKVKLKDVNTLTLYQGKMTNGRRSAPVPQLSCHGGTAGCHAFVPDVVQCYNRGSDGLDVQWECKTEMPNEFKFGKIQVSCEGYDYPDDPFILAGSCGMEYTIDRTGVNQGHQNNNQGHGGNSYSSNGWNNGKSYTDSEDSSSTIGYIIFFAFIGFILYRAIFAPTQNEERQEPYNPEYTRIYPDIPPAGSDGHANTAPPPYSSTAGNTRHRSSGNTGSGNGAWNNFTSFGTGWMASDWWNGRNRRPRRSWWGSGSSWGNTHHTETHHHHHHRSPSPPRSKSSSSSSSNSGSSGTRTTSGFGGTSRR